MARFLPLDGKWKCKLWEMKLRKRSLAGQPCCRRYYAWFRPFILKNIEKMKNAEWPRFIYTKLIFVIAEDNYADYAAADHPFLITVFHLDSLPPYHETSCISLFMYEKWFKAARESGWEKIRVAISKASFPGSSSLTRYSVNSPLDKLSSLFLFPI